MQNGVFLAICPGILFMACINFFLLKIGIIEFSQFCIKAYLGAQAYCKNFACFLKIPQLGIGKRWQF